MPVELEAKSEPMTPLFWTRATEYALVFGIELFPFGAKAPVKWDSVPRILADMCRDALAHGCDLTAVMTALRETPVSPADETEAAD